jgi:iron complex transport system ATP-binding protein
VFTLNSTNHSIAKPINRNQTNLLSVCDVSWQSADKPILQDISFDVAKGEVIGIIGPNGAGKTSILRCIQQLVSDFSGQIHFKGRPIVSYDRRRLAQSMAVVAQQSQPIFSLSVFDVVRMGLIPHKSLFGTDNDDDRHQIEMALQKVGLDHYRNKKFSLLSGGEQQRAFIARALVQGAELLLMDEPTNHLDVYYQHQIMHLVKDLNITVIMTVHDLNLAAQHCQRLILLQDGRLIADGSADEVLQAERLTEVFNIRCVRDIDPYNDLPRVSFHLAEHSFSATSPTSTTSQKGQS